ncbi:hypothetical protein [Desulfocurvibacter africanus]|uniref:hypothetical protein n=1 Tax=Desulfocurvibacter africanus TaxID=873 RepID=UPI00041E55C1|nr:hypothetical protein [Desulfocurvibacter africanus]
MASLAELQADLAKYKAARDAALLGQSYEVTGRKLTRANLRDINEAIAGLEQRIAIAQSGGISTSTVTFGGWRGQ